MHIHEPSESVHSEIGVWQQTINPITFLESLSQIMVRVNQNTILWLQHTEVIGGGFYTNHISLAAGQDVVLHTPGGFAENSQCVSNVLLS